MSSYHVNASINISRMTSASSVSTKKTGINRRLLDLDSHRLSKSNTANVNVSGTSVHQRGTSIVNHHQRRNSQLRKASFAASTLVCV